MAVLMALRIKFHATKADRAKLNGIDRTKKERRKKKVQKLRILHRFVCMHLTDDRLLDVDNDNNNNIEIPLFSSL